jgi:indolepyruvate ferredoxin oxidoreductase
MPGTFTTRPDMQFPARKIVEAVTVALGGGKPEMIEATEIATALCGDSVAANVFMLGYAWQKGWVPLALESLLRAVELNAAAVEMNKAAFNWGRLAAHDPGRARDAAGLVPASAAKASNAAPLDDHALSTSLDDQIARRVKFLSGYQNAAYAERYRAWVERVRKAEADRVPGSETLTAAVARYAFKLMAYKDEYEVARLYTSGDFAKRVKDTFAGDIKLHFHLAPPLFAKKDADGHLVKAEYGPWVFTAFRLLSKFKGLRGTALDPFGYTAERREERRLIAEYVATIEELVKGLTRENLSLGVEIASVPEQIRGFGHVKDTHLEKAKAKREQLLAAWRTPAPALAAA